MFFWQPIIASGNEKKYLLVTNHSNIVYILMGVWSPAKIHVSVHKFICTYMLYSNEQKNKEATIAFQASLSYRIFAYKYNFSWN